MPNTGGFDVMLQFKQDIINDILVRVLNESLITNLHLKSPLSRRIDEPLPPTQVKVWWDKPELELGDGDNISLSVEVTGGARQLATERNLEVDGSVSITRKAQLATDEMGVPYLSLEPPQPLDLHMSKLKVTYPGSPWPPLLSRIDPTRETTILRPLLTMALMIPLLQLPLSYNVKSLPLRILAPNSSPTPSEWSIPITTAMIRVLKEAEAIAMGLSLTETYGDHTQMTTAFPEEMNRNATLTLTSRGINNILGQLRRRGTLKGVIPSSSKEAPVNWQWEVLTIQCHKGYISLTGNFRRNAIPIRVIADLTCSLDHNGSLKIAPLAINTDAPTSETIVSSLYEVLRMILRARAKNARDDRSEEWSKLLQCFTIPGTQIEVEAPACDMLLEEGTCTLLYDVPQTLKGFQAEVPWLKPQVTIIEPNIPTQTAPGAPMSMLMQTRLTTPSFPPYDYVWTTDFSEEPTRDRGPSMTVMGSPTPAGSGPQVYTNVHAKVIDAFGQVAEASAPARYQAQARRQQRSSSSRIVTRIVASIILIFAGIGGLIQLLPLPVLSGPAEVNPGGMLHLHGSGFFGGGDVTLSLDGEALALSGNHSRTADSSLQNRELLLSLAQLAPNGTVPVNSSGNFDVTIQISAILPLGTHTIHASEAVIGIGVRSADRQFTVVPPPKLDVKTTSLDFGQLLMGSTATLSIVINNAGGQRLTWTVDTGGTAWLSILTRAGTIDPSQADQMINVTADTSQLSVGTYSRTLYINSNGGNAQVAVSLLVANATPTAILSVSPSTMNGNTDCSYGANNGWTCFVTVMSDASNQSSLDWSASSTGASFSQSQGHLSPGQATPVTVFIPANTVCPAHVDLVFTGPANIVHVTWSCASPTLSVTPYSLSPRNCTLASPSGWDCTVALSDDQGGANWSASSSNRRDGVTFTPARDTVYPGGEQVTIHVPGCLGSDSFNFAGPGNTAAVKWQCIR